MISVGEDRGCTYIPDEEESDAKFEVVKSRKEQAWDRKEAQRVADEREAREEVRRRDAQSRRPGRMNAPIKERSPKTSPTLQAASPGKGQAPYASVSPLRSGHAPPGLGHEGPARPSDWKEAPAERWQERSPGQGRKDRDRATPTDGERLAQARALDTRAPQHAQNAAAGQRSPPMQPMVMAVPHAQNAMQQMHGGQQMQQMPNHGQSGQAQNHTGMQNAQMQTAQMQPTQMQQAQMAQMQGGQVNMQHQQMTENPQMMVAGNGMVQQGMQGQMMQGQMIQGQNMHMAQVGMQMQPMQGMPYGVQMVPMSMMQQPAFNSRLYESAPPYAPPDPNQPQPAQQYPQEQWSAHPAHEMQPAYWAASTPELAASTPTREPPQTRTEGEGQRRDQERGYKPELQKVHEHQQQWVPEGEYRRSYGNGPHDNYNRGQGYHTDGYAGGGNAGWHGHGGGGLGGGFGYSRNDRGGYKGRGKGGRQNQSWQGFSADAKTFIPGQGQSYNQGY